MKHLDIWLAASFYNSPLQVPHLHFQTYLGTQKPIYIVNLKIKNKNRTNLSKGCLTKEKEIDVEIMLLKFIILYKIK